MKNEDCTHNLIVI